MISEQILGSLVGVLIIIIVGGVLCFAQDRWHRRKVINRATKYAEESIRRIEEKAAKRREALKSDE